MEVISGWARKDENGLIDWSTFQTFNPPLQGNWYRVTKIMCACGGDCNDIISESDKELFPKFYAIKESLEEGLVDFEYSTDGAPLKVHLVYGGTVIFDSGYIGDSAYQTDLDTYLSTRGYPIETITNVLSGSHTFLKGYGITDFGVYVYSPLTPNDWTFSLDCPQTSSTTSTSSTTTQVQTTTSTTSTTTTQIQTTSSTTSTTTTSQSINYQVIFFDDAQNNISLSNVDLLVDSYEIATANPTVVPGLGSVPYSDDYTGSHNTFTMSFIPNRTGNYILYYALNGSALSIIDTGTISSGVVYNSPNIDISLASTTVQVQMRFSNLT